MRKHAINIWKICLWALTVILAVIFVISRPAIVAAAEKSEAQSIVDKSKGTLTDLMNDEHYALLHKFLKSAKGVVIFPQVLKAGFILGGSGGTGVLLVHNETT